MKLIGLDTETHDPLLKEKGTSWVYGEGELLCTSVYNPENDAKRFYWESNDTVLKLLCSKDVTIVGANIGYDLGWLSYFHNYKEPFKCSFIDVEIAESYIDETARTSLEELGKKYLGRGKKKTELEAWAESKGLKGDVREHLKLAKKEVPELLKEYVKEDAELACLVWEKQKVILERTGVLEAFYNDCKMIPILHGMKLRGCNIDINVKEASRKKLSNIRDKLSSEFTRKYGEVNIKSPKQLQAFFDKHNMPYRYKVRIKMLNDEKVTPSNARKVCYYMNRNILKGFHVSKGEVIALYEQRYITKIKKLLDSCELEYTCNPTIDAKWRNKIAPSFPIAAEIQDIAKCTDILSKILGEGYDKYITKECKIHPNFNLSKRNTATDNSAGKVTGTKTGRLSSDSPNGQQIPSKGKLFEGTDNELEIVPLCREMFVPDKNCWALKIDYSQIEYRLLMHFAVGYTAIARKAIQDTITLFNKDAHTDYHQFVCDISGLSRKYAKNLNFGIMYGMQLNTMLETFGWDRSKGEELWEVYHSAMPFVKDTLDAVGKKALERAENKVYDKRGNVVSYEPLTAYITILGGRKLHMEKADDTYLMLNKLNQGSASVIMKSAMVRAFEEGVFDVIGFPHLQVHDELLCSVPKTVEGLEAMFKLQDIMENTTKLKVPVLAEPELGSSWYNVPYGFSFDDDGKFIKYKEEKHYYVTAEDAYKLLTKFDRGVTE